MEVGVRAVGHVEVEDDVDLLYIDTPGEEIGRNQDSGGKRLEILKLVESKLRGSFTFPLEACSCG